MLQAKVKSITPRLPRALPRAAVQKVGAAIEAHLAAVAALTAFLDEADGDPDLEDGGDSEPSLGSLQSTYSGQYGSQEAWADGDADDREGDEHDGREPDVDAEPSLSLTLDLNQVRALRNAEPVYLSRTSRRWVLREVDAEEEHDGREPSLGSLERFDQSRWGTGDRRDLEAQCQGESDG